MRSTVFAGLLVFVILILNMAKLSAARFGLPDKPLTEKSPKNYNNYLYVSTLDLIFYNNLKLTFQRSFKNSHNKSFAFSVPLTVGLNSKDIASNTFNFSKQKIAALGAEISMLVPYKRTSVYCMGVGFNVGMQSYNKPDDTVIKLEKPKPVQGYYYDISLRNEFILHSNSSLTFTIGIGIGWAQDLSNYGNYYVEYKDTKQEMTSFVIVPFWFNVGIPFTK